MATAKDPELAFVTESVRVVVKSVSTSRSCRIAHAHTLQVVGGGSEAFITVHRHCVCIQALMNLPVHMCCPAENQHLFLVCKSCRALQGRWPPVMSKIRKHER